ncbi:hypothetical protein [Rhizobium skierniewicense]|uniref:hypothetical protein n=1 Tax=Rhizobium skierniewicense TaxID=984260 RepID=UPI001574459D|nr:hypothetical protein [Rhizobium skierniewicense]NTF32329.1 hypothetical protein [Rhizobium skierniewicense]
MNDAPIDDGSQFSGRLLAMEMMLRELLCQRADIARFLDETDARIDNTEASLHDAAPNDMTYIVSMTEAARGTVDEFRFQLITRKQQA